MALRSAALYVFARDRSGVVALLPLHHLEVATTNQIELVRPSESTTYKQHIPGRGSGAACDYMIPIVPIVTGVDQHLLKDLIKIWQRQIQQIPGSLVVMEHCELMCRQDERNASGFSCRTLTSDTSRTW